MKNRYAAIFSVIIFISGFVLGALVNENGIFFMSDNANSDEIKVSENNPSSTANVTNDEIRQAINFSRDYLNNPELLCEDYPYIYEEWHDYRLNSCPDENINILMDNYNDWIISYAFFNISANDAEPGKLPRYNKDTPFENYTLVEVESAMSFFHPYLNNPGLLKKNSLAVYPLWFDYRKRVCNNETINNMMEYYNYWIISYSFGI